MSRRNAEITIYSILVVGLLAIAVLGFLGHVQISLVASFVTVFLIIIVYRIAQGEQSTQMCNDEDSCEKSDLLGSSNRFNDIALPPTLEGAVNISIGTASGICKIKVDDPRLFVSALNSSSETITIGDNRSSTIISKDAIEWIYFEDISKEEAS